MERLRWLLTPREIKWRDAVIVNLNEMVRTRDAHIAELAQRVEIQHSLIDSLLERLNAQQLEAESQPEPESEPETPETDLDESQLRFNHYLLLGCPNWPHCRHGDA